MHCGLAGYGCRVLHVCQLQRSQERLQTSALIRGPDAMVHTKSRGWIDVTAEQWRHPLCWLVILRVRSAQRVEGSADQVHQRLLESHHQQRIRSGGEAAGRGRLWAVFLGNPFDREPGKRQKEFLPRGLLGGSGHITWIPAFPPCPLAQGSHPLQLLAAAGPCYLVEKSRTKLGAGASKSENMWPVYFFIATSPEVGAL